MMTSDIFAEAPTPGRTRRSGFSPTKAAALLAAALLLPAAPAAAEELGKLFLTPERRAALERQRQKATFYLRLVTSALSPSNFPTTNPEVLREILATNGSNLVKGMNAEIDRLRAQV